jgi:microcystin degradation protein MlrC
MHCDTGPNRVFIAALLAETNTFSPIPTALRAFEEHGLERGMATACTPDTYQAQPLVAWRKLGEAAGIEVVEGLCAMAQPGGTVVRACYERLRDEIVGGVKAARPDIVLLNLHGAMVAQGYDDCEGDLIGRIRALVGTDVFIGVLLDLHCHTSAAMIEQADVLIAYKEYPHTDIVERAIELFAIAHSVHSGEVRPVTAMADCRMIGLWRTGDEPMRSFVDQLRDRECEPGILSVSLGHGFPYGDVGETGAKLWVVTDNDADLAQRTANDLALEFFALRDATRTDAATLNDALVTLCATASSDTGERTILVDVADNAGGGAPGDSTFILRALLDQGFRHTVAGCYYDPVAAGLAADAGVGAVIDLRVGGKLGPTSGDPVDLLAEVRGIVHDHWQTALGGRTPLGLSVWIHVDGIDLVLSSLRSQTFSPDLFTGLGLKLDDKHVIVVKSTEHFRAAFAPLADRMIYVSTPGALTQDFAMIDYRKRDRIYWPRVADPFGAMETL